MTENDFFDFAGLLKGALVNRKKNTAGDPFKFHDIKWLCYKRKEGVIHYKENLQDTTDFLQVSFLRRGKNDLKNVSLVKRYSGSVPISVEKKKDLLDLLTLIPTTFHHFYKSLKTSEDTRDVDPDLEEEDID